MRHAWIALALAGVLGAGHALGGLPAVVGVPAAAIALVFGGGLPLLMRWSPTEPSWLKLATFAALLSPLLALASWCGLRALGLDAAGASAGALLIGAGLAPLARGARVRLDPPGAAALCALFAALALGGLVLWVGLSGAAVRVSHHGLLHSSIVYACDRALPPENPFLAGTELPYYWSYHALAAHVARALDCTPLQAFVALGAWAAVTSVLALYFLAAPLFGRGRSELAAVALGTLGLSAAGGWLWLARGAPWPAAGSPGELLFSLDAGLLSDAEGSPRWERRALFGLAKFFNASSHASSLAYVCGGLAAGAHALRHGARPWVGLCALMHAGAFLLNPVLGAAALGCTALAALGWGATPGARWKSGAALALACVPGLWAVRAAGGGQAGGLVELGFDPGAIERILGALGLLLPPALYALWRDESARENPERRALLALLGVGALLPLVVYPWVSLPLNNEYKLLRYAALPMGVLASLGLARAWGRGAGVRLLAGAWSLGLVLGIAGNNLQGVAGYVALSRVELPLAAEGRALQPDEQSVDAHARALARAYRVARERVAAHSPEAMLLMNLGGPVGSYGDSTRWRFRDPNNLQGHEAACFAQLSLWCDLGSHLVERAREWPMRQHGLVALYGSHDAAAAGAAIAPLVALERPVLALVSAYDEARFRAGSSMSGRDLGQRFQNLGFRELWRDEGAALFLWPPEEAERLRALGEEESR